jgi:hypothetical protein
VAMVPNPANGSAGRWGGGTRVTWIGGDSILVVGREAAERTVTNGDRRGREQRRLVALDAGVRSSRDGEWRYWR